jgi:hypothetical protein
VWIDRDFVIDSGGTNNSNDPWSNIWTQIKPG